MTQLFVLLTGILVWLSPLLVVGGLLALAGWRDQRVLAATARQTRLSDALADEVGVIVAAHDSPATDKISCRSQTCGSGTNTREVTAPDSAIA